MSRRRKPAPSGGGAVRVLILCSASKAGGHAPYRVARCTTWTEPFTPEVVKVDYVHAKDAAVASTDRVRARGVKPNLDLNDVHITYPFTCRECGRHVPLEARHLAELVARLSMLGVPSIELADLTR